MVLNAHAREETHLFERLAFIGKAKIHMHRRNFVIGGDLGQRLPHEAYQLRPVFALRGQKTMSGDWRKRHADQHLGIILNARMMRRFGPFIIENKLSHAVQLEIHWARCHQRVAAFDHDVVRHPAGLFVDTA